MAYTLEDLTAALRHSRAHFLKHLNGLRDDQWDWKPYPECKSIRETLSHLIVDDRAALDALVSGGEPDYAGMLAAMEAEGTKDVETLRQMLDESSSNLLNYIESRYAEAPLDVEVSVFGTKMKLGGITYFSSEDFYHAGQVAFIRQAMDPAWDYYAAIYGGE